MSDYHVTAVTSLEELNALRSYWESVQWHYAADFEFFRFILNSRRNIISPCVFVASLRKDPVALLVGRIENTVIPIRLGYATLAKISARQMVLIGGGFMGNRTDEMWTHFLAYLAEFLPKQNLDLVSMEHLALNSFQHAAVRRVFGRARLCPINDVAEHWLMRLPKAFDEFMANRSKKRRYWLNRLPRVLDRDFPGQWSMVCYHRPEEANQFVKDAETVASKTYHRGLGVGFRADDETTRRITMEAQRQLLCSYVLFVRNEARAFWYCFRYRRTLYLAATGYDPSFGAYELGTVLLIKVFRDHCGSEIETVDFGLGDAEYKQRFGTEHYAETTLLLFPRTVRGVCLNCLHSAVLCGNRFVKSFLVRLHLAQRLKTIWRHAKSRPVDEVKPRDPRDSRAIGESLKSGEADSE